MNNNKKYWLGYDTPEEQDIFFLEALDKDLWTQGNANDWDSCWSTEMPDPEVFEQLDTNKTINHMPGNSALTIKSHLYNTLNQAKQRVNELPQASHYDFFPKTYSMPQDYFEFQEIAAKKPDWRWIQKPRNMSRGRGIEMVQHPETVPLDHQWIIQRYLDNPHLWNGYKYVLRCYVLITSIEPLRFYWYHEGSAKLTSEKYDLEDLDNPYRHLTNPDINEHNSDADVPVIFHSFRVYKKWLQQQGIDDSKVFSDLEHMIGISIIAARETMREQSQKLTADTNGAYELIGLDCMIDNDLKPWILECNLSPSLEICSTDEKQAQEEIQTKKGMVSEIVNMLGLNDRDTESLSIEEKAHRELSRANGFQCIFPSEQANQYLNYFPVPRYADIASLPKQVTVDYTKLHLKSAEGIEAIFDDSLALLTHNPITQLSSYITPNELATWIWLQNSAGYLPEQIAQELTDTYGPAASQNADTTWLAQIWDMLADWSNAHLFRHEPIETLSNPTASKSLDWQANRYLNLAGVTIQIRCACPFADNYISLFTNSKPAFSNNIHHVDILRSSFGYVLTNNTNILSGSRKLSRVIDDCIKLVCKHCLAEDDIALLQGSVISHNNRNTAIVGNVDQLDSLAYEICLQEDNTRILSGSAIISAQKNIIKCTDLPLLLANSSETISSSYDSSNYYPLAPPTQATWQSSKHDLIKNNWIISETDRQTCWLAPANGNFGEYAQLKNIIFIESSEGEEKASIAPMNAAETLSTLWKKSSQRNKNAFTTLPEWLNNIQGYKLTSSNTQETKSLIDEIIRLL